MQKVGGQFRKGSKEMIAAAEELRGILSDSAYVVTVRRIIFGLTAS